MRKKISGSNVIVAMLPFLIIARGLAMEETGENPVGSLVKQVVQEGTKEVVKTGALEVLTNYGSKTLRMFGGYKEWIKGGIITVGSLGGAVAVTKRLMMPKAPGGKVVVPEGYLCFDPKKNSLVNLNSVRYRLEENQALLPHIDIVDALYNKGFEKALKQGEKQGKKQGEQPYIDGLIKIFNVTQYKDVPEDWKDRLSNMRAAILTVLNMQKLPDDVSGEINQLITKKVNESGKGNLEINELIKYAQEHLKWYQLSGFPEDSKKEFKEALENQAKLRDMYDGDYPNGWSEQALGDYNAIKNFCSGRHPGYGNEEQPSKYILKALNQKLMNEKRALFLKMLQVLDQNVQEAHIPQNPEDWLQLFKNKFELVKK